MNYKINFLLNLFLFLVSQTNLYNQNLIHNPSFEIMEIESLTSDSNWGLPYHPYSWNQLFGSVDYYILDQNKPNKIIPPFIDLDTNDGMCFLGHLPSREPIQGMLIQPLLKDSTYLISFNFKCSNYNTNKLPTTIGLALSSTNYLSKYVKIVREMTYDQKKSYKNEYISINIEKCENPYKWSRISIEYKAKGGEKYIYFYNPWVKSVHQKYIKKNFIFNNMPYLAYDNICLVKKGDLCQTIKDSTVNTKNDYGSEMKRSIYSFEFESDSCEAPIDTTDFFKSIGGALSDRNTIQNIMIIGYTDNDGDSIYNIALSQCRAEFIKSILVQYGLTDQIINCKGLGSLNPIENNNTTRGRKRNRRVEITIYYKD